MDRDKFTISVVPGSSDRANGPQIVPDKSAEWDAKWLRPNLTAPKPLEHPRNTGPNFSTAKPFEHPKDPTPRKTPRPKNRNPIRSRSDSCVGSFLMSISVGPNGIQLPVWLPTTGPEVPRTPTTWAI